MMAFRFFSKARSCGSVTSADDLRFLDIEMVLLIEELA